MSSIFLLLQNVHENVHGFPMKLNYSEPKIYTGGVDINTWSKLPKATQKDALKKHWYVYYSFRNPKTGKLVRQQNIKGGINRHKDKVTRLRLLNIMKKSLLILLDEGFNPYKNSMSLAEYIEKREKGQHSETAVKQKVKPTVDKEEDMSMSISQSFELVLRTKSKVLSSNSYVKFKSRVNRFKRWLEANNFKEKDSINCITKKDVILYLNSVLQSSSPRNRNNTRTDLGSFFQTLMDNDVIHNNFVKQINVLKSTPERNKTFTPTQEKEIYEYLKKNKPTLYLFIRFIYYNLLRPIEVCRLKIGDLDLIDKKLYVRAKNQPVKAKIIPDILLDEIPDLTSFDKDDYLFTPDGIGGKWDIQEINKRDYFTKQFKKVKDELDYGTNHGLYSFRHTSITKLYKEMAKTAPPHVVKGRLLLITGHATMGALEQYLRDIDAVLPEDYSKLLE
ncbi:site-specific integrase [Winogradskyella eckloniae]|uniref:tyrosine-type recombinase/integrase n=1 Tax=Winogradskyella eckloniae TaxID=1089306 RepID=UPI00156608F5|nr:site-specific integrase [Winogradskyella eckloniae]NRD19507.1 site-specific integrase [Winogradskyella eckloniae]